MKAIGSSELNSFNILHAINAISDAWNNVTHETIANCWIKTGILPQYQVVEMNQACQQVQVKLERKCEELSGLITNLAKKNEINDPMDANEFINIDAKIIFKIPFDTNIICAVENKNEPFQEEIIEPVPKIADNDALKAINLIETYLLQQSMSSMLLIMIEIPSIG
ncbi:7830_t:CDS:1 [Cetraspora pellucida]|uniref:7830_t:CDS:1 n=1 Tax=Cetraspora pellucida TaxID=1433469 RepID=A0A9N9KB10_9GLOM|nr:7830_t:CDS:1 [Cetraspora pellucida]